MPDVYRGADLMRWNLLLSLAEAAVSVVVVLAAGGSLDLVSLIIFLAFSGAGVAFAAALVGRKGRDETTAPVRSRRAALARVARTNAVVAPPLLAVLVLIAAADGDWWIVPGSYLVSAIMCAAQWLQTVNWERRHPGAFEVTDGVFWRARRLVRYADARPEAA